MKRSIIVLIMGLSAAHCGGLVHAQSPSPTPAPAFTKVAVVNLGIVFNNYDGVKAFKAEMDDSLKPYKQKKAELEKRIKEWQELLKEPAGKLPKKKLNSGESSDGNVMKGEQIIID